MTHSIEELKALRAKATPGPWRLYNKSGARRREIVSDGSIFWIAQVQGFDSTEVTPEPPECAANAELIPAAVNALPELLDEIERLQQQNRDQAREWLHVDAARQLLFEDVQRLERELAEARLVQERTDHMLNSALSQVAQLQGRKIELSAGMWKGTKRNLPVKKRLNAIDAAKGEQG